MIIVDKNKKAIELKRALADKKETPFTNGPKTLEPANGRPMRPSFQKNGNAQKC